MFKILISQLLILSLFIFVPTVIAEDLQTTPQPTVQITTNVQVNHIASTFEKIQEKFTLFTKFNNEDKVKYQEYLAEKRLAELKFIIENNQIDSIEEVASRYETYIGSLTNFVVDHKVISEKEKLQKIYSQHQMILEDFSGRFEQDSGWWFVIQHDININKISSQRIKNI